MGLKRKPHQKSRNGCGVCKHRRIKCDEQKPRCSHCVRLEADCVYPERKIARRPSPHSDSTHPTPSQASVQTPTSEHYAYFNADFSHSNDHFYGLNDLAFLHHWTLTTSRSIVESPQMDHVWQSTFPNIGFRHNFVMQGLLCLSALHIAYLHPPNRRAHMQVAAMYHTQSLNGFRNAIAAADLDHGDALFVGAILAFLCSFVTFGELYEEFTDDSAVGAIGAMGTRATRVLGADWIPLVRGLEAILGPVYDQIRTGPLEILLDIGNWDDLDPDVHPGVGDEQMLAIRQLWKDDNNHQIYEETLQKLRKGSAWVKHFQATVYNPESGAQEPSYNQGWSTPFIWLFMVPEGYLKLQRQRQPIALVLFAYFGTLIQQIDRFWWAQGCAKNIVAVTSECLGPFWDPWIAWPKSFVGLS
ncbi:hypothetical protein BU24DRAFT_384131 [Aaosphaeria arxii CBS 175.79]|uniref:Zn(2)-C6 fungal-type domain-containing protein n=1 Tax=Aaosphaeria arxii CBS 175.79 TaxID=1450172 RepID=A0A6A5Y945_9PLEO|nr:uncharacterized protein BU24DRAFT_384131 [Aaosphaeria arxii CBS 175.79]KAF2021849.1 hypothetical protein BU24DRAFT_384131 [Aaosphaeria arxii CBS 175.79]